MALQGSLTNEALTERFESPFALVNRAIRLAKARILRGDHFEENPAVETLEDLLYGEEESDEVLPVEHVE